MGMSTHVKETRDRTAALKRRSLIAAGAALATGVLSKLLAKPAAAGHTGSDRSVLHLGQVNEANGTTQIEVAAEAIGEPVALAGVARDGGVVGLTSGSSGGAGVTGVSVIGDNLGDSIGVAGLSRRGTGVNGIGNPGVVGLSNTPQAGGVENPSGVFGVSFANNGIGVWGLCSRATGVYGLSSDGYGVRGFSYNNTGVSATGDPGIFATGTGGTAAEFNGNVRVQNGDIIVAGLTATLLSHPDGSLRQLFGVASTESWLEDLGEGKLAGGRTEIGIDPDFAALVRNDDYQVFLTPYGNCEGLYVSERGPAGFTVGELHDGKSDIEFGYRIVAKRHDAPTSRLERVELPPPPPVREEPSELSQLPELPKLPQLPPLRRIKLPDLATPPAQQRR
jgi:hypothetical protein